MKKNDKTYTRQVVFSLILFILAVAGAGFADAELANKVHIIMVVQAEVAGENMRLGDIAAIEGDDPDTVEKLKAVSIGKAPLPGKSRRIDRNFIELRLKQNNIQTDGIKFNGTIETEVVRGYQEITKEEIEKIVTAELPTVVALTEKSVVKDIHTTGGIILPKGKYTYTVEVPKNSKQFGKILLSVIFVPEDGAEKRVYVSATIEQFADVVVTKFPLRTNHVIGTADVELKKMNLSGVPSNCITDINDVLGNKIKRNLTAETVLRADMIDIPPLIQKKDVVIMVAETDQFKIVTLGESKDTGYKGDLIKVINLESNNEVYARIIDGNSVKVEF